MLDINKYKIYDKIIIESIVCTDIFYYGKIIELHKYEEINHIMIINCFLGECSVDLDNGRLWSKGQLLSFRIREI